MCHPLVAGYIQTFVDELKESLPKAILFLKQLGCIELLQDGKRVFVVTRRIDNSTIRVDQNGDVDNWRILEASFPTEAKALKVRYSDSIKQDRSDRVRVAVPKSSIDDGLLYATLPTEQSTRLPFHIDADFYPASDRKSIVFGDNHDPRSVWNRAAIRAAASAVQSNLISLRDMYNDDASAFWAFISRIQEVHQGAEGDMLLPLGEFWKQLLPSLERNQSFTQSPASGSFRSSPGSPLDPKRRVLSPRSKTSGLRSFTATSGVIVATC